MKVGGVRWNEWNIDHATKHGCSIAEIESVARKEIRRSRQRNAGGEKWIVRGRGQGDRLIQVIFLEDLDGNDTIFVIHAMPVSTRRRKR